VCDGLFSLWNLLSKNKLILDESFMKQARRRLATIVAGAVLFAAQSMVATAQSGSKPESKKPAPVAVPPPAPVTLPPNGAPAVRGAIVPPSDYVIGPDDVLGIVFWREKELSADVVVRPDGKISLPLLDEISVVGLTPAELRAKVMAEANKLVEDANATVVVKQINSRRVFITGAITKPGAYALTGPMTVVQLIALAGGLVEFADGEKIKIMRTEKAAPVALPFNYKLFSEGKDLAQNISLKPGDTVIVP
jgi:polysaccharide biosynthesis/export protein